MFEPVIEEHVGVFWTSGHKGTLKISNAWLGGLRVGGQALGTPN